MRTTTPGQRTRAVIASNPPIGGEGDWLVEWFAPWLNPMFSHPADAGELRWCVTAADGHTVWVEGPGVHVVEGVPLEATSRTFISARLDDNPYLRSTNYRAQIMSLDEPLRSKLLEGDFLTGGADHERQVIPTAWITAAQERWRVGKPVKTPMTTLGVDVAQGGSDDTVLAALYDTWFDEPAVHKGVDTPNPHSVSALIVAAMRNGCHVVVDATGGWGSGVIAVLPESISSMGVVFSQTSEKRTRDDSLGFAN
jgi:hypothetical protein